VTTPVQPLRRGGGRGSVIVGLSFLVLVGMLAWHPWSGPDRDRAGASAAEAAPSVDDGSPPEPSESPSASPPNPDEDPSGGPIVGSWSDLISAEWSIVAFLRADPVSRDPLTISQQQVAVFVGTYPLPSDSQAICDQPGTDLRPGAAGLGSGEVSFLGIAFPLDRGVEVASVDRLGQTLDVSPVDMGRIPGVRMFGLVGGGTWPDGVYRFRVVSRFGLPGDLYACIRP
jgi:hypothetical protein